MRFLRFFCLFFRTTSTPIETITPQAIDEPITIKPEPNNAPVAINQTHLRRQAFTDEKYHSNSTISEASVASATSSDYPYSPPRLIYLDEATAARLGYSGPCAVDMPYLTGERGEIITF